MGMATLDLHPKIRPWKEPQEGIGHLLTIRTSPLNKQYDVNIEKNKKLSFLSNKITRPCGYVEGPNENEAEEPAHSLATASRIANIQRNNNEIVNERSNNSVVASNNIEKEKTNKSNAKIVVDFENLNDEVGDQGQLKESSISDNRSSYHLSNNAEYKETLTFKPEGVLKTPQELSNTPVSFGGAGMLNSRRHEHDDYE